MSSKVITGRYGAYYLHAPVTDLTVAASGYVAGSATLGIYTSAAATAAYAVVNLGTVKSGGAGVLLTDGGAVTNGAASTRAALIVGATGVEILAKAGTVENFGDIEGANRKGDAGVGLAAGGYTRNGTAIDIGAVVAGESGVSLGAAGTVANFGTIYGYNADGTVGVPAYVGVRLSAGGLITNGASVDTHALIQGAYGVDAYGVADGLTATVANFGTILGNNGDGVLAGQQVTVVNGAANDAAALIRGRTGASLGDGTIDNFGTVLASAGYGISMADGTIDNLGLVQGGTHDGIRLAGAGQIVNGSAGRTAAQISGATGLVVTDAAGSVTNYATITGTAAAPVYFNPADAGVYLEDGGSVTNQASGVISGQVGLQVEGAAGEVTNLGTIQSAGSGRRDGIYLADGGAVINGSTKETTSLITGYGSGVDAVAAATVANLATITAVGEAILLRSGGEVINGAANDTGALLSGIDGVESGFGGTASVSNFATISGGIAVSLSAGGTVTNGASDDVAALITGFSGVSIFGPPSSVTNFGTIVGTDGDAAYLGGGGRLTNGAPSDPHALIRGNFGVRTGSSAITVVNFATIDGNGSYAGTIAADGAAGVRFNKGGFITNGNASATGALIAGQNGVGIAGGAGTIDNLGTIETDGADPLDAIVLGAGGLVTNGSVSDAAATIDGEAIGVALAVGAVGALTNFGTIESAAGYGVSFAGAGSTLNVEAGSTIVGSIAGGGGTLDLASGTGTIASIVGGDITATGASDPYDDFGALEIGKGADFTLTGDGTVASGGVAALVVDGVLDVTSTLGVSGALGGAGTLEFTGNTAFFDAAGALKFAGRWLQTGGAIAGSGTLDLTGAGGRLQDLTLSAAKVEIDAASATLAGAIDLTSVLAVASPKLTVAGATALTGSGALELSDTSADVVMGASASAILRNSDKIEGAGNLGGGQLRLTNEAAGIIDGNAAKALVVDTGAGAFVNDGLVEAVGAGGLAIDGPVNNAGTLEAAGGTLTVDGAVTGAGSVRISGSTADFAAAFSQNVAFTSAGGLLELADSQAYAGTISGFSKTGASSLDLEDISFATATESYSGTAASGVLTVTDGTHTAKINLTGNYLASVWTLSSDTGGGTVVTDPAAPSAHGLAAAMAGFAPTAGGAQSSAPLATPLPQVLVAAPAFHV